MNEFYQLASAMLVLAFAAAMLVVGQLYMENQAKTTYVIPASLVVRAR
jgi:hypothetical protein